MSNLFGMYATSTRAMQAQSYMIATASHNIANAETEGYSRQRVSLSAADPVTYRGVGQLGTGVQIDNIKRLRDTFLDVQVRQEISIQEKYKATDAGLNQVELIFNREPSDTGLSTVMNKMWNSWAELAKTPEGSTNKSIVLQRADDFTKSLNQMYEQLETLNKNTVSDTEKRVYDTNALLGQLQDTTSQIYKMKLQGVEPNDLLDRRDLLLEKISGNVNINVEEDKFGRVRITEADSGQKYELLNFSKDDPPEYSMSVIRSAEFDAVKGTWTLSVAKNGDSADVEEFSMPGPPLGDSYKAGDVLMYEHGGNYDDFASPPYRPKLGAISGNQAAIEKNDGYMAELDKLAYAIASAVNTVHGPVNGNINSKFFELKAATPGLSEFPDNDSLDSLGNDIFNVKGAAKNIKINDAIMENSNLINAKADLNSTGTGDGSRADAIAKLQLLQLDLQDPKRLNAQLTTFDADKMTIAPRTSGSTTSGFYNDLVGKIGVDKESCERNIDNQGMLILQIREKQNETSAVSIDEEITGLVQFQTAYQANARVINTLTTVLDTLINLGK